VPNAVFERLLEAVAAGQSAELMEQLNLLLNAGHSPSSLARQMVRYLRNALMAKLDGEQTQLLQISGDERARAARTALLFTEEELTRNLQIVLRTFDDLNYRQEQRFHLELGLLKLIHAQRLLPLEELLSGVGTARNAGPASPAASGPVSTPRPPASTTRPVASPAPAAAPALSPFGPTGGSWSSGPKMESSPQTGSAASPVATMERLSPAPAVPVIPPQSTTPFPAASTPAKGFASAEMLTEGALGKAPQTAPELATPPSVEAIRHAVGSALVEAGHESAAQLLGAGVWAIDGSSMRIEVAGMGKKMIALTVNAAAEKIIRQELQRLGAPTRFLVVPGEGGGQKTGPIAAPAAVPPIGSVQEAALANPLVQKAQEIFKAEVRSVVDLRQK
jgi:DNA polymerase-3 subunit gamma/tau